MTQTKILSVEIDDVQFKAFQQQYARFQAETERTPEAWRATDAQVAEIAKRFRQMRQTAEEVAGTQDEAAGASEKTRDSAAATVDLWSGVRSGARRAGASVGQATASLRSWERLTGVFSGLIAGGGLYGLNTLAAGAAVRRRDAAGLGVGTGEASAFRTDFGRLGDTDALLAGLNAAATDVTKRQPLYSLGIDPRGKNAAQLGREALPRIKKLLAATDRANLGGTLRSYHLDALGVDDAMARRILDTPDAELETLGGRYDVDAPRMDVPDEVGRGWQELSSAMARAETRIGTAVAGTLVNVAPGLTRLSDAFVKTIDAIMSRPDLNDMLRRVGDNVKWLGDEIGGEASLDALRAFMANVKQVDRDIGAIVRRARSYLDPSPQATTPADPGPVQGTIVRPDGTLTPLDPSPSSGGTRSTARVRPGMRWHGALTPSYDGPLTGGTISPKNATDIVGGSNAARPDDYWGDPSDPNFARDHLVTIKTPSGKSVVVNKKAAQAYSGFLADLEASGYSIDSLGGYSPRRNVNNPGRLSMHAFGDAIDINSAANPNARPGSPDYGRTDLPANVSEMAARHGLSWGGDWRSVKDTMHFEFAGPKADALMAPPPKPVATSEPTPDDLTSADRQAWTSRRNPFLARAAPKRTGNAMLHHPNARRTPAAQTLTIVDNTGGSTVVTVAH